MKALGLGTEPDFTCREFNMVDKPLPRKREALLARKTTSMAVRFILILIPYPGARGGLLFLFAKGEEREGTSTATPGYVGDYNN